MQTVIALRRWYSEAVVVVAVVVVAVVAIVAVVAVVASCSLWLFLSLL